jgi:hypothetical protein
MEELRRCGAMGFSGYKTSLIYGSLKRCGPMCQITMISNLMMRYDRC